MSDSFWRRLIHGTRRLWQRQEWPRFAGNDWPDWIMETAVTDRFHAKQGRSTGRWILHADGDTLSVYIKRHKRLSWWRGLFALIWPRGNWSPAFQEFQHLEWASSQGIPVPPTVAAGEYIAPSSRLQSFLAVEELKDMLPLHEAIPTAQSRLDAKTFRQWKSGLIVETARLTNVMHQQCRFHKDLYLCHFYVAESDVRCLPDWRGRVFLIDFHRLGNHPWMPFRWQMKDLAQLLYSSDIPGVDERDRLLFWRAYLGDKRNTFGGRWLKRAIMVQWRNYRRHSTTFSRESLASAIPALAKRSRPNHERDRTQRI